VRIFLFLAFFITLLSADREGGPYLGFGYGMSEYDDGGMYDKVLENEAKASFMYGGAYINKYLSVEIGYVNIKNFNYKIEQNSNELNIGYTLYNVSTLAHYAFFDDLLDFYAKFGAGYVTSFGEDGSSFIYGIGTSLRLSELLSIKVAYDIYDFGYDTSANGSSDYDMKISYPYIGVEIQF
jgi:hypothetical protein